MLQTSLFDEPLDEKFREVIILDLKRGTGVVDGKLRILEIFNRKLSMSETISLLQEEYGTGGCSNPIGKYSQRHDSRGMEIRLHDEDEKRHYSWSEVYDMLYLLISSNEYL